MSANEAGSAPTGFDPFEASRRFLRPGTLHLTALPPLSLYVHWPWCVRKCPYCDFNSHESSGEVPEAMYLDALRRDLELALPLIWGRKVASIFIGGGTPSLMSAAGMDRLLAEIRALLPLLPDCEITMEANPGTVEANRFKAYRDSGINRISLGIQSFDDVALKTLGRIHGRDEALKAAELAATLFERFNLDLMHALPGHDVAAGLRDLETALQFAPPHLSMYQLTMEPNTVFAKYPPADLPDEDTAADLQDALIERAAAAGLQRYEVSAYARTGFECWHNRNYWEFGDYLGIGAGAHSKLSFPHRVVRQVRHKQPQRYLEAVQQGTPLAEEREVKRSELPFEFMLNALRLLEGVPSAWFAERTGMPVSAIKRGRDEAIRRGWLVSETGRLQATPLGFGFLNDVVALFLCE